MGAVIHQSLIVLDGAFVLLHQRAVRRKLLLRNRTRFHQVLITSQIDARIGQQRLVAKQLSFRLGHRRLVWTRVDFDERIALFHQVAFLEMDAHQLPIDAALKGHCVDRSDGPQPGHVDPDIPGRDLGGNHGRRRCPARLSSLGGRSLLRTGLGRAVNAIPKKSGDRQNDQEGGINP
jgi:hypothetical protein